MADLLVCLLVSHGMDSSMDAEWSAFAWTPGHESSPIWGKGILPRIPCF